MRVESYAFAPAFNDIFFKKVDVCLLQQVCVLNIQLLGEAFVLPKVLPQAVLCKRRTGYACAIYVRFDGEVYYLK